jgi:hypothetical protein
MVLVKQTHEASIAELQKLIARLQDEAEAKVRSA